MVLHLVASNRQAVKQRNWYSALTLALTLPDICGRLESPHLRSQVRYEAWWNAWVADAHVVHGVPMLSGADAYALRCAVVHEGRDDVVEQRARDALTRFVFVEPVDKNTSHAINVAGVMVLRVDRFCEDVCAGVERWVSEVRAVSPSIINRSSQLMKVRHLPIHLNGVEIRA